MENPEKTCPYQETDTTTSGGDAPSETSAKTANNAATPSKIDKVRQLIETGDAEGLQKLLYGNSDPDKSLLYGNSIRETVCTIALRPKFHAELVDLAITVAARWVSPASFIRMLAAAKPHLYLLTAPVEPMSLSEIQEKSEQIPELTDSEMLDFLRSLYYRRKPLYLPRNIGEDLATWAINSSSPWDWRQMLLCLAQFIPDPYRTVMNRNMKLRLASRRMRQKKASRRLKARIERRTAERVLGDCLASQKIRDDGEEMTYTDSNIDIYTDSNIDIYTGADPDPMPEAILRVLANDYLKHRNPDPNPGAAALFEALRTESTAPLEPDAAHGIGEPVRPPYADPYDVALNG